MLVVSREEGEEVLLHVTVLACSYVALRIYLIESVDDITDVRCQFSSVLLSPLLL